VSDDWLGHQEKSEECAFCFFQTEDLVETKAYAMIDGTGPMTPDDKVPWAWLCNVCRSTNILNSFLYPRGYNGDLQVIGQAINLNTNIILQAIKELK